MIYIVQRTHTEEARIVATSWEEAESLALTIDDDEWEDKGYDHEVLREEYDPDSPARDHP